MRTARRWGIGDRDEATAIAERSRNRTAQPFGRLLETEGGLRVTSRSKVVEYVGAVRTRCVNGSRAVDPISGRLNAVDTDGPVEKGCGEQVRIARAPVDLESPVRSRGKLSDNLGCLRIPA